MSGNYESVRHESRKSLAGLTWLQVPLTCGLSRVLALCSLLLTPVLPSWAAPDGYEPDGFGSVPEIVSGSPQVHSIDPANDVDLVYFTLTVPSHVTLETSGPSGDTRLCCWMRALRRLSTTTMAARAHSHASIASVTASMNCPPVCISE
jgi:hypothetical protein